MGIYLLLVPVVIVLAFGLYLVFKSKSGRTYRRDGVDFSTKKKIEDLHTLQTHNFWRDFGK